MLKLARAWVWWYRDSSKWGEISQESGLERRRVSRVLRSEKLGRRYGLQDGSQAIKKKNEGSGTHSGKKLRKKTMRNAVSEIMQRPVIFAC